MNVTYFVLAHFRLDFWATTSFPIAVLSQQGVQHYDGARSSQQIRSSGLPVLQRTVLYVVLRKGSHRYIQRVCLFGCATEAQSYFAEVVVMKKWDADSACFFRPNPFKEKHVPRSKPWPRQRTKQLFIAWPRHIHGRNAPNASTWWIRSLVRSSLSAAAVSLYFWTKHETEHDLPLLRFFFL